MLSKQLHAWSDSYKHSHAVQYPIGTSELTNYIESRGGPKDGTIFFGLQMFLKDLSLMRVTKEMVLEAEDFINHHIGPNIFRTDDWMHVVNKHQGKIPLEISAVTEGEYVPTHNILVKIRSTDERLFWMPGFMETSIMRSVWFPTTVATNSNAIKELIYSYLLKTFDDPQGQINFKLHDFAQRGVSSGESAGIGGAAHSHQLHG